MTGLRKSDLRMTFSFIKLSLISETGQGQQMRTNCKPAYSEVILPSSIFQTWSACLAISRSWVTMMTQ